MADHFYSVLIGDGANPATVDADTSTNSETIELRLRDGDGLDKLKVLNGLEALKAYFQKPDNTVTA